MAQKRAKTTPFEELTWSDLQEWAGPGVVSRGRSYQRSHRVQGLARTPGGGVVAWVQGTHRYATVVEVEEGELAASCTCPYGGTCKHAVAVVLEYLEHLKQKREVPTVTEQDRRLTLFQKTVEEEAWDEEDEESEDIDRPSPQRSRKATPDTLASFLEQQTKEQLITLLKELAEHYPVVRQTLQDRRNLSVGAAKELVNAVRQEIAELSAGPGWGHDWGDEEDAPDFSRVQEYLEALLVKGHADEVVKLGKKLLEAGKRQVEMSHDGGEMASEVISCLNIVFRALPQSSLSPAEQMLWAVETELEDQYDLCQGANLFWEQEHAVADWNLLAEKLTERLDRSPSVKGEDDFTRNYRRDRLSNWLIHALEQAGRDKEIIPLCQREAEETGSYVRLVNYLKNAKRWEEAEQWIHKGIEATQKRWPGIASQLRTTLREIREKDKDWLRAAAFYAEDFFHQPSLHTFQELQKAAERAGVWLVVRAAAMHYLETGELPQITKRRVKDQAIPPWPLPETGVMEPAKRWPIQPPMTDVLIDIAIAEKRPDEVIRWYDRRRPMAIGWGYSGIEDDKVAEAVVGTYPDRALAIWKKIAEAQIAQTQPRAYEMAAGYLRKAHRLLKKLGREQEWKSYLTELRQANLRKRRLVEILDDLAGRRIIG